MRIPRLYYPSELKAGSSFLLNKTSSHYLHSVLRLRVSDAVIVFNGDGYEYHATITDCQKKSVSLLCEEKIDRQSESPLSLHLGQVMARGDKMDLIIQKAVELGVSAITPLQSERCNVKLSSERQEKRLTHWQGVIISACEQSGRLKIPTLYPIMSLQEWIVERTEDARLILEPKVDSSVVLNKLITTDIALLVGSEGGFSEEEIQNATTQQFASLHLGPRILRTETAALTALSVLQYTLGDFG